MTVDNYLSATPVSSCEFLTVEQLAQRLHISRATVFSWMQRGIFVQGRHFFKRGHVLRFIWCDDLILHLMAGTSEDADKGPTVQSEVKALKIKIKNPINWEY